MSDKIKIKYVIDEDFSSKYDIDDFIQIFCEEQIDDSDYKIMVSQEELKIHFLNFFKEHYNYDSDKSNEIEHLIPIKEIEDIQELRYCVLTTFIFRTLRQEIEDYLEDVGVISLSS